MTDAEVEKLIQPLLQRQQAISNWVVRQIARRVKEIGTMTPSDLRKLISLYTMGQNVRIINQEIARIAEVQEREIKRIIKTVAADSYIAAKPFYDYRHKAFIPLEKNEPLQKVIASVEKQTIGEFKNLSKAQAFMIRDLANPKKLIPTSISKTYQSVIDEAVQAVQSGATDFQTAMRRTMEQLIDSGIQYVTYQAESGRIHHQRLDSAVRRNILDGVRAINQGVQDETGKQFGADGKELSVHAFSALDHEPVQGHQFSNEEYEKLQSVQSFHDAGGNIFAPIERAIGTLNCRHFAFSIVLGAKKPNYTKKQLQEFIKKNHEGYTLPNGKHLTMYECTQKQREYELKIRKAKEGREAAEIEGDEVLKKKYQAKVTKYQNDYREFSKACGLSVKFNRTKIFVTK